MQNKLIVLILLAFFAISCDDRLNPPLVDRDDSISQPGGPPTGPTIPDDKPDGPDGEVATHEIITMRSEDGGYFVNSVTGEVFVPRGNNLTQYPYHSMLDPATFDPAYVEERFVMMNEFDYNIIRTIINHRPGGVGDLSGTGLSADYINNIYTLLDLADTYDIYVILSIEWLPDVEPYRSLFGDVGSDFAGFNAHYLTLGGHQANVTFFRDFVSAVAGGPHIEHLFGYQIRQEFFYDELVAPFYSTEPDHRPASVTTADGSTYDPGDPDEARFMVVSNALNFIDQVTAVIREEDPLALVSAGLIAPRSDIYGKQGIAAELVATDSFDYLDLHIYPHEYFNTLDEYMIDFGLDSSLYEAPIMFGEFGAKRERYSATAITWSGYTDDLDAADDLVDWQVASCAYSLDGWITWAWDSAFDPAITDDPIRQFYTAIADIRRGDRPYVWVAPIGETPDPTQVYMGILGHALSPAYRSDPCDPEGILRVTPP